MKKIILSLLLGAFFAPAFVSAQATTINLTSTQLIQISQCSNFDECPEVRELLLELLRGIVADLLQERIAEAREQDQIQDNSNFEDATYNVLPSSGLLSGQSVGAVPDISVEIWEEFRKVAPQEYIEEFVSYIRVFFDEDEFSSAYVETDLNDREKWGLGINLADLDTSSPEQMRNLVETLIHEFAHILTLNSDQLERGVSERRCGTYFPGEGCTFKNSYLNEFVDLFWDEDDFDHSEDVQELLENEEDISDSTTRYFQDTFGDYVSPYATSHPAEDIAESFAFFVLNNKPSNDREEVREKILYFYEFEELTDLRDDIRDNFEELFNF